LLSDEGDLLGGASPAAITSIQFPKSALTPRFFYAQKAML
jgi:hypothetical protein